MLLIPFLLAIPVETNPFGSVKSSSAALVHRLLENELDDSKPEIIEIIKKDPTVRVTKSMGVEQLLITGKQSAVKEELGEFILAKVSEITGQFRSFEAMGDEITFINTRAGLKVSEIKNRLLLGELATIKDIKSSFRNVLNLLSPSEREQVITNVKSKIPQYLNGLSQGPGFDVAAAEKGMLSAIEASPQAPGTANPLAVIEKGHSQAQVAATKPKVVAAEI